MKSLKELFVLGPGPSSSHTIGPYNACLSFLSLLDSKKSIIGIDVTLFGSLALTGKGHRSDQIILKTLNKYKANVIFDMQSKVAHPNTMSFVAHYQNGEALNRTYLSIGGGAIKCLEESKVKMKETYPFENLTSILDYMKDEKLPTFASFVRRFESKDIDEYLKKLILFSFATIESSLTKEGPLPGRPNILRCAKKIFEEANKLTSEEEKKLMLITSFAYATAEANANGEMIVTTPTCGSSGVLPSVLYFEYKYNHKSIDEVVEAMMCAGIIGNVVKQNASISGAVGGCQAEIGTASAMASSALSSINHLSLHQIEYASEVALEHFLGLTCDPVGGYVLVPCIERNGMASIHATTAYLYAKHIAPTRQNQVSFDSCVEAMKITGDSLSTDYRETSIGGLANILSKEK